MENTIDTLKIKVEGDSQSAVKSLNDLLSVLERIKGATTNKSVDNLTSKLESMKSSLSNIKTEKFSAKLKEILKDFNEGGRRSKKMGESIKSAFSDTIIGKFGSKLSETLNRLGRVTFYRAIRAAIRQVTEAFKTGIDNMYQYSKLFNGEYAQSMDTLASANLTFKNSIGAIMAPLINQVTPWIDSFVDKLLEINNTVAMVLAGLAGKTTYSKAVRTTKEYAEAANKASDNTDKVTESVEKLKRSLAGLDEITVIGEKLSPVSSATKGVDQISNGTDYGSMFVETPVNMRVVDEWKRKLETILDIAKMIGLAIVGWKLAKFISSIAEAITGLGLLKTQMLGITMMVVGFGLEFAGGFDIGKNGLNLKNALMTAIGSAIGIAGSLLTFGTGPLGWTVGIAAAIVIAITSITVGLNARLADVIEQAFYDGGGTITISDLADQFERLMNDIINVNKPIVDAGITIDNTMEQQVRPAIETIRQIGKGIEFNAYTAEEKIPELVEQFEILRTGTKTILDEVYGNVIRAISGSLSAALADAGEDVPNIVALLAEIKGETDTTFDSITKNFEDAKIAYDNGTLSAEDYAGKILSLTEQMNALVGATDPVKDSFAGVDDALASINWESKDAKDLAFSKVNDSATAATQAVNDAHAEIQENLETMRKWSDNADYQLALDKLMIANDATQKQQLESIKSYTAGFYDKIQSDMLSKMTSMTDALGADYEKLDPIQKFFTGTKDDYIAKGLKTYTDKVINPVTKDMKDLYKELGIEGGNYASDAASEIINGLFAWNGSGRTFRTQTSMETAIYNAYDKIGKNVPEGLVKGISSGKNDAVKAGGNMVDNLFSEIKKKSQINSPSRITEGYGRYIDEGFAQGIRNNQSGVLSSLDDMLNQMLSRMETFTNRWRTSINQMFDDIAYGWRNADFRSDGSYSYRYLSARSIQRFAQGGFPEDGLFYANHNELVGQFSNGRTAVANNEQIIEGISEGVAAANADQNALIREQNNLLRQLLAKDSTIAVSTIASALNRKNQRDGKVTVPVSF